MEEENNRIVETLLGLSGASDEHMEEVLSAIPLFTERNHAQRMGRPAGEEQAPSGSGGRVQDPQPVGGTGLISER